MGAQRSLLEDAAARLFRFRSLAWLSIVPVIVLAAAACGASAKHYTLGATEHCLSQQAAVLRYAESDADVVGLDAPGGGVAITLAQNQVTLAFERNPSDASDDVSGVGVLGVHTGPKLHADANVYVSWDNTPTDAENEAVEGCLSTGDTPRTTNKYPSKDVATFSSACETGVEKTGEPHQTATRYCGCVLDSLQGHYTLDQVQQLSPSALQPIYTSCQTSALGTSTAPTPHPTTVTEAEVRAYYDKHREQYTTAESRDVRHILIAVKGANGQVDFAKSKAEADRIRAEVTNANFASLAKRYSADPGSRDSGGNLTDTRGNFISAFETVAFKLKTGEISQPVRSTFGYHIIQAVSAVRAARTTPYTQVRDSIRKRLEANR